MTGNLCEFLGEELPKNLTKCVKCGELKSPDKFGFRSRDKHGEKVDQRKDCTACRTIQNRRVRKLKKYNPLPDLDVYQCPHCHRTQKEIFETGSWVNTKDNKVCFIPDHDHNTGEFRGYICQDCNTVIARAKENVQTLRNIADALESYIK